MGKKIALTDLVVFLKLKEIMRSDSEKGVRAQNTAQNLVASKPVPTNQSLFEYQKHIIAVIAILLEY